MIFGKLGSISTLANTTLTVYSVPANINYTTLNINILNTNSADAKIRLAISALATPGLKDYIEYDLILSPNAVLERTAIVCTSGEKVSIFSNVAGVVTRIHGIEEITNINNLDPAAIAGSGLDSPSFIGTPTAPTPIVGTENNQLATTAFVSAEIANDAAPKSHVGVGGTAHAAVTTTVAGFMSAADKVKLDGIAVGGGGGAVDSVAGKTGVVTLVKADVGLGSVDNTSDAAKPVSTAQAAAIALKADIANPTLTGVPAAPTAAVGTSTTQLATTAFVSAEIANDATPIAHVGTGATAHAAVTTTVAGFMTAADKVKLDGIAAGAGTSTGAVDSVAGKTGVVTLVKADVGLGSVDNTTDAAKPVSTAQATAIALKANLASPTLTGVPAAPTAVVGTSTTQLATTAFVNAEIANDAAPIAHVGTGAGAHAAVTTTIDGFMTAVDKVKLDGIATSFSPGGVSEIGRYLDFHGGTGTADYDVRLESGIGNSVAGSQSLTVYASSGLYCDGNISAYSDERLKTNWRNVTETFIFDWSNVKHGIYDRVDTQETQVGLSAQSVQTIVPEAVTIQKDGILALNYGAVAAVATVKLAQEVIKHDDLFKLLLDKISYLEERIKQLETK